MSLTGLGEVARVRAPAIVALVMGQLVVPLTLTGSHPPVLGAALTVLGLAVADALLAATTARRRPELSTLAAALAAVAWCSSVLVGLVLLFEAPEQASLAFVSAAAASAVLGLSPHPALRT